MTGYNHAVKMIATIIFTYVFPAFSSRTMSPTESPRMFNPLTHLMCAHYDPKATEESVNNNLIIKALCYHTEKPTECLEFLGNTAKANPVYAVKTDVTTLRKFLEKVSEQASTDQPQEVKSCFDSCAANYKKVSNSLNEVFASLQTCEAENKDGKCSSEEATKVTTTISSSLSDVESCGKALDGCTATIKKLMVDVNADVNTSLTKMFEVSKTLSK